MHVHEDAVGKNPERVAAGLKAAIHNPNVGEDAKERAAERLEHMDVETTTATTTTESTDIHDNRVLGGYKATLTVSKAINTHVTEMEIKP